MLAGGKTIGEACRALEIAEATFHRRRNQYGGMKAEEARRLKKLEQVNKLPSLNFRGTKMSYSFTGPYSLEAGRMGLTAQREKADARLAEFRDGFLVEHVGPVGQDRAGRVPQKNGQRPGLFRLRELRHDFHGITSL